MYNQIKYAARQNLSQRLIAVGFTVLLNIAFGICGMLKLYGNNGYLTAITLSSLSFCAILVVNIIVDFELVRSLYTAPSGYLSALTPTPGWKILLGRLIPTVLLDFLGFAVGIAGILLQSYNGMALESADINWPDIWFWIITLLNYLQLVLVIYFACAVTKSLFFRLRLKGFLGFLTVIVVLYAYQLVDLLLIPFATVTRTFLFVSIVLHLGANIGTVLYVALILVKIAALFFTTSYLIERKINL